MAADPDGGTRAECSSCAAPLGCRGSCSDECCPRVWCGTTATDADFAAKRAEKQEELNTKHGQKDGKNPCFFHHGTPGGCRFSADDCKQGFH